MTKMARCRPIISMRVGIDVVLAICHILRSKVAHDYGF
jgi:hypothetical protein